MLVEIWRKNEKYANATLFQVRGGLITRLPAAVRIRIAKGEVCGREGVWRWSIR
jgi:hypothetical protein